MKIVRLAGSPLDFNQNHLDELERLGTVITIPQGAEMSQVLQQMNDADVLMTYWGLRSIKREIVEHAPNLKYILHAGGSIKSLVSEVLPDLLKRGIRVSGCNDAVAQGVAATALGLTIVSLKNIWVLSQYTRQGHFKGGEHRIHIKDVHDITVGVVGAGKAGRHYMRHMRNFDVRILVYDPVATDEQVRELGAERVGLEQLMSEADVVSIHAPSIPATYRMINAERLQLMKDRAILINTARGSIIDEAALIAELQKGRLWACIDVTDPEPPAPDHPFRTLPNVILTPHLAGLSQNGRTLVGKVAVGELRRYVSGEALQEEADLRALDVLA
ncbi:hydroxyacid dehydrogenase [Paenibacillus oceani]|uniref:Hydroxyacid dehydrogenase n=1 Tax=Paenibacillus oceani TaxID=2772510 RepID=A0A927C7K4_9BACL|nr:hydroxyacid dehydrogenase [Paenibacillus oceani]MBD2861462.1 hydroxyacid dehydrogenase [Paenibacillus oceani]